ncbi:hypothetical protein [Planktomarina sp.]|jgi:hypothetical protein|uniref:hypothetical protein n=1 Tax=Planktomarina sp. TaxID=2024851 RepID=UPI0032604FFE
MAVALRTYLNNQIKAKGSTLAKEKAKAGKYKSIAAAKKAGALYYTDKNGKVMAAVYAEDLKKASAKAAAPKKSLRPKARPTSDPDKIEVKNLLKGGRGDGRAETKKRQIAEIARKQNANPSYQRFQNMSNEEKKAAGLPISMGKTEESFNRFMAARKKSK